MKKIAFHTLGCKVNQYDTQAMLELFKKEGYQICPFEEVCDVYVVNTCTVTNTGDKKSLNAVRRCFKKNAQAHVIISGCLAQKQGEALLDTGACLIIGNKRRHEVVSLLNKAIEENVQIVAIEDIQKVPFEELQISEDEGKSRAAMKIQEGCDRFCTYCIIPYVRGGIRSRDLEDIQKESLRLTAHGYQEIVLTGIHLTSYGRDKEDITLLDAIKASNTKEVKRLRLGSLEPVIITEDFVREIANIPALCGQFHLALQSGSDSVLKRMKRRYTIEEYRKSVEILRKYYKDPAITTDIITGFPGETEEEFEQTCNFVKEIGFARIHVFPFSKRKGTKAYDMQDQIQRKVREDRARKLIEVGKQAANQYKQKFIGEKAEVLFETCENNISKGYTKEYIEVYAQGHHKGILPCVLLSYDENGFIGKVEE